MSLIGVTEQTSLDELEKELLELLSEKREQLENVQKQFVEFKELTNGKEISVGLQHMIVSNIRRSIDDYRFERRTPKQDIFFQMLIDNFDKILDIMKK